MRSPLGDHTGVTSSAGSVVNRLNTPRFVSSNQMSTFPFPLTPRYSATRWPSRESDGNASDVLTGSPT